MVVDVEQEQQAYAGWAIVELMGHRRMGGKVQEVSMFGSSMMRIDVYPLEGGEASSTHFYGSSAIYAIHPTSERIARAVHDKEMPQMVYRYELPEPEAPAIEPPAPRPNPSSGLDLERLPEEFGAPEIPPEENF